MTDPNTTDRRFVAVTIAAFRRPRGYVAQADDGDLDVMVLRTADGEPYRLPGDYLGPVDTLEEAANTLLFDQTHLVTIDCRFVTAFSDPARDPDSATVALLYTTARADLSYEHGPTDLADGAAWVPVPEARAAGLVLDHADMLTAAVAAERARADTRPY